MRAFLAVIALGAMVASSMGCAKPSCLTTNATGQLKVKVISANPLVVNISGWAFQSAKRVKRVEIKQAADVIHVCVITTYMRGTGAGSFDQNIQIPENVSRIEYGSEREVIWSR